MDNDRFEYLVDFQAYAKELNKILFLPDKDEAAARQEMLSEVMELTRQYYDHVNAYNYQQYRRELIERGICFTPVNDKAIKTKWTKLFAASISKEERKHIHYEQYRWHLFSYELLEALSEDAARSAFDIQQKDSLYLFYQHTNQAFLIENAHLFKAEDFDHPFIPHPDFYLFDPKEKWTYIHTHEPNCGPYFYRLPK